MGFPTLVGSRAGQFLVKKADAPSAVDGEARVCRLGNHPQIIAPVLPAIDGSTHVERVTGGISVSPSEIDMPLVAWFHGDRDSAPDALISKDRTTKGNGHAPDDPHAGHSVSPRRGWLPERHKRTRPTSKV